MRARRVSSFSHRGCSTHVSSPTATIPFDLKDPCRKKGRGVAASRQQQAHHVKGPGHPWRAPWPLSANFRSFGVTAYECRLCAAARSGRCDFCLRNWSRARSTDCCQDRDHNLGRRLSLIRMSDDGSGLEARHGHPLARLPRRPLGVGTVIHLRYGARSSAAESGRSFAKGLQRPNFAAWEHQFL